MDLAALSEGGAEIGLTILGMAFPASLPLILLVKEAIPALMAAKPFIAKAVQDGKSAFHAAEAASPGLGPKLEAIAKQIPMAEGVRDWATHLDIVTSKSVHEMYVQNLHDSGYDPKNDFDEHGNMRVN